MLNEKNIKKYLSSRAKNIIIDLHQCVPSTNDVAKQFALCKGSSDKEVLVVSSAQSAGRGRRGRSFFSPDGTGLYMSILLRPSYSPETSALLTTAAATATALSIEKVSDLSADIKWINDIYFSGKKACGILCESVIDSKTNSVSHLIVGIGINLTTPEGGFPDDIKDIATSVFRDKAPSDDLVCELCASIVNLLLDYFDALEDRRFLKKYRERLFILGKEITVITPNDTYTAFAEDIDKDAHLCIRLPDNTTRTLSSGEISIRPTKNN